MWIARSQTMVFLERFSMVVVLRRANWTEDPVIPSVKRKNKPARATVTIQWMLTNPVSRFASVRKTAMMIKTKRQNTVAQAVNWMKNLNEVSLMMPPTHGQK